MEMPPLLLATLLAAALGGTAAVAEAAGAQSSAAANPASCLEDDACAQRLLQEVTGNITSGAIGRPRVDVTDYLAERASPGRGGGYSSGGDTIHIAIQALVRNGDIHSHSLYLPELPIVVKAAMHAFATGAVLEPPEVYAPFNYNAFIVDEHPTFGERAELLTLKSMNDLFMGNGFRPPVIAVIGGMLYAGGVAHTAGVLGIPYVSFFNNRDSLSDREEFPLLCRYRATTSSSFRVLLRFVAHFNYTRVTLMYAFEVDQQAFVSIGHEMGFDLATFRLPAGTNTGYPPAVGSERETIWDTLVKSAKDFNAHVIVEWYGTGVPLWDFMHYLALKGLSGKGYLHLGWAACSSYRTTVLPHLEHMSKNLKRPSEYATVIPVDGYFYFLPSQGPRWDSHFAPWWEALLSRRTEVLEEWILDMGGFLTAEQLSAKAETWRLASLFDAVWGVLLATNSLLLEYGPNFTSQELYERIKSSSFEGISGSIRMDEIGNLQVDFNVWNCQQCSAADVAGKRLAQPPLVGAHQWAVESCMEDSACEDRILTALSLNASSNMSVSSSEEGLPDEEPPDFPIPSPGVIVPIGTFLVETQTISFSAAPVFTGCTSEPPPDMDLPCPGGTFYDRQNAECLTCPAGRFQGSTGRTECLDCAVGTFSASSASEACLACPLGQFASSVRSTTCYECSPGRYMDEVMQKECRNCGAGTFTATSGQSRCGPCELGDFAVSAGSTACEVCAGTHHTTKYQGSVSADLCVCASGFFSAGAGAECQPCKEGMSCPVGADVEVWLSSWANASSGGAVVGEGSFPVLLPTYYSSPDTPLDVFQCSSDLRCPGGAPGTCGKNLQDVACAHCAKGYEWDGKSCVACNNPVRGMGFMLAAGVLGALPFGIYGMYRFGHAPVSTWGAWTGALWCVVFVTVNHYSTLQLLRNANVVVPAPVRVSMEAWNWVNEWMSVFRLECEALGGFAESTALQLSSPFVIGACSFGLYLIFKCMAAFAGNPGLAMEPNVLMHVYMSIIYTFFNAISALSMSFFNCYSNPNGLFTLAADRSVVCYTSGVWMSLLGLVIPAFGICVLGSGALFVYAVVRARVLFADPGFQTRWTFLFIKYRPDVWWWSLVYLAKVFLFNLAFSLFPDAILQLYFTAAVMLIYTSLVAVFLPYRFRLPSYLEVQASAGLVLVILVMVTCIDSDAHQDLLIRFSLVLHYQPWPAVLGMAISIASAPLRKLLCRSKGEQATSQDKQSEFLSRLRQAAFLLNRLNDGKLENFAFHVLGESDQLAMRRFVATIEDELMGYGRRRITEAAGGGVKAERLGELVSRGTGVDQRRAIVGELVWSRSGDNVIAANAAGQAERWALLAPEPAEVVAFEDGGNLKQVVLRNKAGEESAPLPAADFVLWAPPEGQAADKRLMYV